ncbi:MAG: hypothetical protein ACW99A_09635 [Candidatus Kariarchaeaceae archaeon]|jgi:lipopolysaccharide export LptBFGC system permease protein LptF
MKLLKKEFGKYPLGIWIVLISLGSLLFIGMGGQMYSLLDWDNAVDLGLQNERLSGDLPEKTWAEAAKSEAKADMIWFLPILIFAFIGVIRRQFFGFTTAMMSFGIGVYFTLIFAFSRWDTYRETVYQAFAVFTIPSLLGIIGLWYNREYFDGISVESNSTEREMNLK